MSDNLPAEKMLEELSRFSPDSEGTKIEAARAVAQVQAALIVARRDRRDKIRARNEMQESCTNGFLAERAFFSFRRGGGNVSGPTIHLAVELARCWGNIEYGIQELSRGRGQSEMLAFAWDLETNAKAAISFIVPHKRDKKGGAADLESMRDIYENNSNMGARRLREMIFRVLPVAFVEEAKALCHQTLQGDPQNLPERREKLLTAFTEISVTREMVEKHVGRSADNLTPFDVGNLGVVYKSITRGETTVREVFGEEDNSLQDTIDKLAAEEGKKKKAEPPGCDHQWATEDDGTAACSLCGELA